MIDVGGNLFDQQVGFAWVVEGSSSERRSSYVFTTTSRHEATVPKSPFSLSDDDDDVNRHHLGKKWRARSSFEHPGEA